MKKIAALLIAAQLALTASPVLAQNRMDQPQVAQSSSSRTVATQSWVEEWDPVQGRWVKVADDLVSTKDETLPTVVTTITNGQAVSQVRSAARYAQPASASQPAVALAQYGPFIVTSPTRAQMVSSTNGRSPEDFDAMMRAFPGITTLDMVEAPGTSNDIANLAVGRKIREFGIATHVPRGGSVRSGAVELFLAGETRSIEDGATFAVHSWLDNHGREADDFAADHPAHRLYLDYYTQMGMNEQQARDFYAMTNSVPHASARWMKAEEMREWIAPNHESGSSQPVLARHAARQIAATCNFCERVDANAAETIRLIETQNWDQLAPTKVEPIIAYDDVSIAKIAWAHTSLLDS